jgi:hypothetical protein
MEEKKDSYESDVTSVSSINNLSEQNEYDEFTQNLVTAMLGVRIDQLKPEKQEEMVEKCIQIYYEFIIGRMKEDEPDYAMYLKASTKFEDADWIWTEIPELADSLEEVYQNYLDQIELSWNKENS